MHPFDRISPAQKWTDTGVAGDGAFRGHVCRAYAASVPMLVGASLMFAVGLPTVARAAPLPYERSLSLGTATSPVQVRIEAFEQGTRIRARARAHSAEATLPVALDDVEVEAIELAGGASAALVRGTGNGERAAALVVMRRGRPVVAWTGRLEMRGDPGERTADAIEIADRTGDGVADVVVGQRREGVGLCGQPAVLLYPRALDPVSGELRPVVLRRFDATEGAGEEVAVEASASSPGPSGPPVVRALSASGESSALGVDEDARALGRPQALTDGRDETAWTEGRGGYGEGELVVLRFGADRPIRAIALTAPTGAGLRAPRTLWIAGNAGPRLRVTWPEGATRVWVVPPEPVAWSCFAVVLGDAGGEAAARTGIAEIDAYTEIDFGGGLDALVAELVRDEASDRAVQWLARLGAPAVRAIDGAWERLGARGRERAVRVVAAPARSGDEVALGVLDRAARDESEVVRAAALGVLAGGGASQRIAVLAQTPGVAGEDAASALATASTPFPVAPLLDAIASEGGSERPRLRAAVARGVELGDRDALARDLPSAGLASVALGLAENEGTRGLALASIERAAERAETFGDRYRVAMAATQVEVSPALSARLAAWAQEAEEWMLRRAALGALGAGSAEVLRDRAVRDPYPRVRVAAIERLAALGALDASVLAAGARDGWPMVRVARLDALADRDEGALTEALGDDAQMVRRRAIEHLTRRGVRTAAPTIAERLVDPREWPTVIEAGLEYVGSQCVREAGPAVVQVVRRGARDGAWEPDIENAIGALRVAARLGGETWADARQVALRGGPSLQGAVDGVGEVERCPD